MKKLFLILFAIIFVACENGTSAPNEICYDKKIGYEDFGNPMYKPYKDQWLDGACEQFFEGTTDCIKYNYDFRITVRDCMENVEFH